MSLEELREFLQERIAQTFSNSDDIIVEQLQASMTELRKMKLDLPPPGTRLPSLTASQKLFIKKKRCHQPSSHFFRKARRAAS